MMTRLTRTWPVARRLAGNRLAVRSRHQAAAFTSSSGSGWYDPADLARGNVSNVPRLPIPELDDTMRKYLSSARAVCQRDGDADFAPHAAVVAAFAAPDGNGPRLQALLRERDEAQAAAGGYPFSFIESAWDDMYLGARYPNPILVNPSYHLELPGLDATAATDRFANLARFALGTVAWHHKVLAGQLDREAGAVCFSVFAKQLGAARVPAPGRDLLEFHPHARHVAVFCGSNIYTVDVLNERGEAMSEAALEQAFRSIAEAAWAADSGDVDRDTDRAPVALLTSCDRDEWAAARAHLVAIDPANAVALAAVDSALLSIAIDGHTGAASATDFSTAALLGNTRGGASAQPRWFDKHQLLSLENGELGYNFEHSYSDGMSWNRMLSEVAAHVQGAPPPPGCQPLARLPTADTSGVPARPVRLDFRLDDAARGRLEAARAAFAATAANVDNRVVDFTDFGKDEIKTWRHSPDAVVQLALIMAFARCHGRSDGAAAGLHLPGVYEACSVNRFLHGRTETIRSLTEPAAAFVKAVEAAAAAGSPAGADAPGLVLASGRREQLQEMLTAATTTHRANSVDAVGAMGIDRHLLALQLLAQEEGVAEPLFQEPLYAQSKRWLLSTSNVTADFIRYFAFGAVDPHGYGIGYMINPDTVPMNISCFHDGAGTDAQKFGEEVRRALLTLRDIAVP